MPAPKHPNHSSIRGPQRGGFVMAMVVVFLVVLMGISVGLFRTLMLQDRSLRKHDDQLQVNLLLDAGLQRARAQLALDADYTGETWLINGEQLGDPDNPSARIDIKSEAIEPEDPLQNPEAQAFDISLVVVYPADETVHKIQTSKTQRIYISKVDNTIDNNDNQEVGSETEENGGE